MLKSVIFKLYYQFLAIKTKNNILFNNGLLITSDLLFKFIFLLFFLVLIFRNKMFKDYRAFMFKNT